MKFNVIATSPTWQLSGVNTLSVNLIRGLRRFDIPAKILLTEPYASEPNPLPVPADIPMEELAVGEQDSWQTRWQTLIRHLEQHAPCIYLPNYDWRHSCVSPRLSRRVGIVGIAHSDEPLHYEHVSRLGRYWNAIVTVSKAVGQKVTELDPALAKRVVTISNGVSAPSSFPQRSLEARTPLRIVHAGRLVQHQKRVFDLPKIVETTLDRQTPVELTIIGDGAETQQLQDISRPLIERGAIRFLGTLPNERVLEIFEQSDVFVLTSEFEGMPVSLLEAMGRGCVPVATDVSSGIPELVHEAVNGYRVPVGDIQLFAERLTTLYRDLSRRQTMSLEAYRTICEGGYRTEDMVQEYVDLFRRVLHEAEAGIYERPRGPILPPPHMQQSTRRRSWKSWLPRPVRVAGHYAQRVLRQVYAMGREPEPGDASGSSPSEAPTATTSSNAGGSETS